MTPRLSLRKERLGALDPADLAAVVGGTASRQVCVSDFCPTNPCITWSEGSCSTIAVTRETVERVTTAISAKIG